MITHTALSRKGHGRVEPSNSGFEVALQCTPVSLKEKENSITANPTVCLTKLLQKELWVMESSCSYSEQILSSHISEQVDEEEETKPDWPKGRRRKKEKISVSHTDFHNTHIQHVLDH